MVKLRLGDYHDAIVVGGVTGTCMMPKTLLLCFIHGFKGGQDTFGAFPEHLRALVRQCRPTLDVHTVVYPKYETRGNLAECVSRFREWLTEQVIDLEVRNGQSSPTIDPSVRVLLIGHSMGGILAVDTVLGLISDLNVGDSEVPNESMFPYIQGILAFDTPYLGIAPGVFAHFNPVSIVGEQLSGLTSLLWESQPVEEKIPVEAPKKDELSEALSTPKDSKAAPISAWQRWGILAMPTEPTKQEDVSVAPPSPKDATTVPTSAWQRWGKVATLASTSVVLAAGGVAAAYVKRDSIKEGWSWMGSHLEFVGCLVKVGELQARLAHIAQVNRKRGIGFGNFYTRLGKGAIDRTNGATSLLGWQRTFCNLPPSGGDACFWRETVNDDATNEMCAHTAMFLPRDNSGYDEMSRAARDLILDWTGNNWYMADTGLEQQSFQIVEKNSK
ncbi:hypothetical protein K3495_g10680 [Podosphaera aphanis]|nr:hypothetical protein K3495_g10680 [Podosphaera aphanis]